MNRVLKLCIAVAAVAACVAVPASAMAVNDPSVITTTGDGTKHTVSVTHAAPKAIEAKNVGDTTMTAFENIVCTSATLKGNLETNNISGGTGAIEGTINSAEIGGDTANTECHGGGGIIVTTKFTSPETGNGIPWCLRSTPTMNTNEFQVRGGGCTEPSRSITFSLHTTNIGTCIYERTTAITGTYTTHPDGNPNGARLTVNTPVFNRETGSGFFCPSTGELHMTFELQNGIYIENQP